MRATVEVLLHRTRPAPAGMGWIAVERWDTERGEYRNVTTCRGMELALDYIRRVEK